jgi:hypothetical protein
LRHARLAGFGHGHAEDLIFDAAEVDHDLERGKNNNLSGDELD